MRVEFYGCVADDILRNCSSIPPFNSRDLRPLRIFYPIELLNMFAVASRLRRNLFLNRVLMEHLSPNTVFQIVEKQILDTSYMEMVFILAILKFVWLQYMLVLLKTDLEVMLLLSNKDRVHQF